MGHEEQVIEVALEVCEVGKRVLVHATGHPAKIVAVGVAAGLPRWQRVWVYRCGAVLLRLAKKAR